jgi:hypothetical protein
MVSEIWQDFFTDHQTKRALASSEVWQNYLQAEVARDEIREQMALEKKLDDENEAMAALDDFREKIAANPALKAKFKNVLATLEERPDLKERTDPAFLHGLSLIDFED